MRIQFRLGRERLGPAGIAAIVILSSCHPASVEPRRPACEGNAEAGSAASLGAERAVVPCDGERLVTLHALCSEPPVISRECLIAASIVEGGAGARAAHEIAECHAREPLLAEYLSIKSERPMVSAEAYETRLLGVRDGARTTSSTWLEAAVERDLALAAVGEGKSDGEDARQLRVHACTLLVQPGGTAPFPQVLGSNPCELLAANGGTESERLAFLQWSTRATLCWRLVRQCLGKEWK